MKKQPKKKQGEQLSAPATSGQQEKKPSAIPIDEEIKLLARRLRGIGKKLTKLAETRKLKFLYIVATVADDAAANDLREAYLTLRERRASYANCPSARFIPQASSTAPNIYSGPASSDECYALLWMDDNDCEIVPKDKLDVDEKVIRFSEYRLESGIFPAFPELARKLHSRSDVLSKYLWVQFPHEAKKLLEKWSQPDASTAWKKTREQSRHRICDQFRLFIENLLPYDWFCQVFDGENLTYEDQIVGLKLSPYVERLKSVPIDKPVDYLQLNRTILNEIYPNEFPKMRPSCRVLLSLSAYLLCEFWAFVENLCQTRSSSYPVADELLAFGHEFVKAFSKEKVVKIAACCKGRTNCAAGAG